MRSDSIVKLNVTISLVACLAIYLVPYIIAAISKFYIDSDSIIEFILDVIYGLVIFGIAIYSEVARYDYLQRKVQHLDQIKTNSKTNQLNRFQHDSIADYTNERIPLVSALLIQIVLYSIIFERFLHQVKDLVIQNTDEPLFDNLSDTLTMEYYISIFISYLIAHVLIFLILFIVTPRISFSTPKSYKFSFKGYLTKFDYFKDVTKMSSETIEKEDLSDKNIKLPLSHQPDIKLIDMSLQKKLPPNPRLQINQEKNNSQNTANSSNKLQTESMIFQTIASRNKDSAHINITQFPQMVDYQCPFLSNGTRSIFEANSSLQSHYKDDQLKYNISQIKRNFDYDANPNCEKIVLSSEDIGHSRPPHIQLLIFFIIYGFMTTLVNLISLILSNYSNFSYFAKYFQNLASLTIAPIMFTMTYKAFINIKDTLLQSTVYPHNVEEIKKELLTLPIFGLITIHDLHIWHLASDIFVVTFHAVFNDQKCYELALPMFDDYFGFKNYYYFINTEVNKQETNEESKVTLHSACCTDCNHLE